MGSVTTGIYGATGYTGYELVKILQRHPQAQILFATSQSQAGRSLSEVHAGGPDVPLSHPQAVDPGRVDVVFLCLPHGASAATAVPALDAGARVIDLSADFRLKDAALYEAWYKVRHPAPELLEEAVYGLTEAAREAVRQTRLVANPGCYATTALLALRPLMAARAATRGRIIVDAKSGVTGAGRKPKTQLLFAEVADNFAPYNIGRSHRHLPEMEQVIGWWQKEAPQLVFSPHLLPVTRGILATIYVTGERAWAEKELRALYAAAYEGEAFVDVLAAGELASLTHVTHTNKCVMSLTVSGETLIITSVLDNLIKGAAGQAVQNMNVMLGLPETMGLCVS